VAENLSVGTTINSQGQPVGMVATISDTKNNSFQIVGIPGGMYNLGGNPQGGTLTNTEVTITFNSATNMLITTELQTPQPMHALTFTATDGDTVQLLGSPNTAYDLDLLTYLLAIVEAQDMFLSLMFGDDYTAAKYEFMQRGNLV
jgi:hypothetical protein